MAEGEVQEEPVGASEQEVPVENQEGDTSNGANRGRRGREDQTPIEELYDLTKPIPRVERPSKDAYEKNLADINAAIDTYKEDRAKLQAKIDSAMDSGRNSEIGKERELLSGLRAKKGALIDEKKAMRSELDATRDQADKLVKDRKDAKSNIRGFNSIAEIDAEIAALKNRQETTSMSLQEEKRLIKDMDALQASKKVFADMKSKETNLEGVKEQRKAIQGNIVAKDKEIDEIQKLIEEKQGDIKKLSDKESDKREALQSLFAEREDIKKMTNEKHKERDTVRTTFRESNNAWYNYQRAVRAQKKMQYEEEKKKREEERLAWEKMKEEEESKKIPYEEEQALCEYLANHLEDTYLKDAAQKKKDKLEEAEAKKKAEVVAVTDDPFKNFKPVNKKTEDEYFGKGKGKKKKNKPKTKDKATEGPFKLNVDAFEQFGLLGLNPPTRIDMVEASVKELREKKVWFSEQPRGSVPTAAAIRKEREKNRQGVNGDSSIPDGEKKGKKGGFSLSTDDFAPLGREGASSGVNAKWGQKQIDEPEATADEDADEEEAVEAEE